MLWQGRVGDIAAMWLTISGVAVVVILSAIMAPLIGEIGTPVGI
jgi:hypothetical protein